jgi:hypothetical protein
LGNFGIQKHRQAFKWRPLASVTWGNANYLTSLWRRLKGDITRSLTLTKMCF